MIAWAIALAGVLAGWTSAGAEELDPDFFSEFPAEVRDGDSFAPNLVNAERSALSPNYADAVCALEAPRYVPSCPLRYYSSKPARRGRVDGWESCDDRCRMFIGDNCELGAIGRQIAAYWDDPNERYTAYNEDNRSFEGGASGRLNDFFDHPPADIQTYCPKYKDPAVFTKAMKTKFWIYVLMHVTQNESFCDREDLHSRKTNGGRRLVRAPHGAFQLEYDQARRADRPAECQDSYIKRKFPRTPSIGQSLPNIRCALSMFALQLADPKNPSKAYKPPYISVGRLFSPQSYWERFRYPVRRNGKDPVLAKSIRNFKACGNPTPPNLMPSFED